MCECLPDWTWTDPGDGKTYGPFSNCQLPAESWTEPWCFVDPACTQAVCTDAGGPWGSCTQIGDQSILPQLNAAKDCGTSLVAANKQAAAPSSSSSGSTTSSNSSTTSSDSGSSSSGSGSSNTGAIVGGVVGGVLGLLLLAALLGLWLLRRRRRRQRTADNVDVEQHSTKMAPADEGDNYTKSGLASSSGTTASKSETSKRDLHMDSDHMLGLSIGSTRRGSTGNSAGSRGQGPALHGDAGQERNGLPELPYDDWRIQPADIEFAQHADGGDVVLGEGAYGKVYRGSLHGVPVAVKVMSAALAGPEDDGKEEFLHEVAMLKSIRSPNIVQFVGASLTSAQMLLVTELCAGGNLSAAIRRGAVNWHKRGHSIALNVAQGLQFLHARRIVHFDLKSPNVLLSSHGTAKIADVGLSRILRNGAYVSNLQSALGTFAWAAPEVLLNGRCTEKVDIFSFGVVLWEIITGERPQRGSMRPPLPEEAPPEVVQLMDDCWLPEPAARPTAAKCAQRLAAMQPAGSRRVASMARGSGGGGSSRPSMDASLPMSGSIGDPGSVGVQSGPLAPGAPTPEMPQAPPAPELPLPADDEEEAGYNMYAVHA